VPGWYVHLQSAQDTAERLRSGSVPPGLGVDPADARELGEICHTWRNYLALGSLGPDLFYLLPDFADTKGCVIRQVVAWVTKVWEEIDHTFVSRWEKWIEPISDNSAQLASQLTGGLSQQLAEILDELTSAVMEAFKGLLADMGDWFGVLTSGVPQGYGDDAFYWSDTFHYRRTYQFPFVLFRQARAARAAADTDEERLDADARTAFAVGWMTHCATDVTGHPFTNAKSGGPYRDHWQRHHLVENHIDSDNYHAANVGPCYGEYGTSALHFRVAFRHRDQPPYAGRDDGPAYDYFAADRDGAGAPAAPRGRVSVSAGARVLPGRPGEAADPAPHTVLGIPRPAAHGASQGGPFDPARLVLSPQVGYAYRVFVRVWNLGLFPAVGVLVRAWAVAAGFFGAGNTGEPYYEQHEIGGAWVDLKDRRDPGCVAVVELDTPWLVESDLEGHSCLLASVGCPADSFDDLLLANQYRHVGQRNLTVLGPDADTEPLVGLLADRTRPRGYTLELTHGGPAAGPLLLALGGREVRVPRLEEIRAGVDTGTFVHLLTAFEADGLTVVASSERLARLVDGVDLFAGPGGTRRLLDQLGRHGWAEVAEVTDVPLAEALPRSLMRLLDVGDLQAATLAERLGGPRDARHLLRFALIPPEGEPTGGYSIVAG
jgi:hypothetical protein